MKLLKEDVVLSKATGTADAIAARSRSMSKGVVIADPKRARHRSCKDRHDRRQRARTTGVPVTSLAPAPFASHHRYCGAA
jgi:hypothetical protein